jgi:hypothetical protein
MLCSDDVSISPCLHGGASLSGTSTQPSSQLPHLSLHLSRVVEDDWIKVHELHEGRVEGAAPLHSLCLCVTHTHTEAHMDIARWHTRSHVQASKYQDATACADLYTRL